MGAKKWSHNEFIELLAWLDFCKGTGNFDKTIVEHMRKSTNKERPIRGIAYQLCVLANGKPPWVDPREDSRRSLTEIRDMGTSCMPELDSELRETIRQKVERYKYAEASSPGSSFAEKAPELPPDNNLDTREPVRRVVPVPVEANRAADSVSLDECSPDCMLLIDMIDKDQRFQQERLRPPTKTSGADRLIRR